MRIGRMMADLRDRPPETVGARPVVERQDYLAGLAVRRESDGKWTERRLVLPASDVLKYAFDEGSWVAVRPSGTEPDLRLRRRRDESGGGEQGRRLGRGGRRAVGYGLESLRTIEPRHSSANVLYRTGHLPFCSLIKYLQDLNHILTMDQVQYHV
ncbi:hypothetical protein [Hydrogenibacillus schlegelii]|uniref:hypothetical protein n=1 Tax=Hydrogenibacillus schlegelii TaxID=1484 RepID=UPI0039E8EEEE